MGQKVSPVGFFLQPESPFLHFSLKLQELRKTQKITTLRKSYQQHID